MKRRPPVPVVRYFAFVMPVYDRGADDDEHHVYSPAEEWALAESFLVLGWDLDAQEWVTLGTYEDTEFKTAKRHAREHHESVCERLGMLPYFSRRSAVTAPQIDQLDTMSSIVYQSSDVTGNVSKL